MSYPVSTKTGTARETIFDRLAKFYNSPVVLKTGTKNIFSPGGGAAAAWYVFFFWEFVVWIWDVFDMYVMWICDVFLMNFAELVM